MFTISKSSAIIDFSSSISWRSPIYILSSVTIFCRRIPLFIFDAEVGRRLWLCCMECQCAPFRSALKSWRCGLLGWFGLIWHSSKTTIPPSPPVRTIVYPWWQMFMLKWDPQTTHHSGILQGLWIVCGSSLTAWRLPGKSGGAALGII